MYFNIETHDDMKKIEGGKMDSIKKNNCIIFVRMNGCYHCDMMKNEWNSMVKEKIRDPNLDILEIERSRMQDMMRRDEDFFLPKFMGIRGFPTIMFHNRDRKVFPFQGERNKNTFLKFIKKHSKPVKTLKPESKKPETETSETKQKEGLNKNGQLKKGFRYNKEGKIIKAKPKK